MLRTIVRRAKAQSARQPAIRFPDRKAPHQKSETHPHPAAPAEIADDFPKFQKTLESGPHFDANKLQPFELAAKEFQVGMRKEDMEAQKRGGSSAPSEGGVDGAAGGSRSGQGAKEAGSGSGGPKSGQSEVKEGTVEDLHDLPPRFWKTSTLVMDEVEMEAVMSGGASLSQRA
ncbi:hypothetical protein BCV69DRAFT_296061 [Microstroma glucosiphilum]|uniref:Ribosomal protein S36, mitochondrial n=1 Tax=Pseudomicrostroma glucosiphilum TaxID=1684307 RepID=A0A316UFR8_9BASI|nr:hypothetical protein BCV69DRAFT_296061 [Pseudomicrostroma glucosiphilum]PWN23744.1 hypothetical protein BCV69DRAFT_296061 [Pseudomicrostroma glucosiphilum]